MPREYCESCGKRHNAGNCKDNIKRGEEAAKTLEHYASTFGEFPRGMKRLDADMIEQNMSDLICNFAHYCDRRGVDMGQVLRRAQGHYEAETQGAGEQTFYADSFSH